ncbi:sensor histidine kinase [Streptantibioticus ferralitis]|uniref:histidine kinase n=1 Tax=Streptantibioticus ferralitis TaxID=236510 RepID=A0ABT5ZAV0_9ACTN|nr:histidine kinase [Streptantibioticus ferralitis]MDF2260975.1 histidine kinase [Streptantibioticus ferralitis]
MTRIEHDQSPGAVLPPRGSGLREFAGRHPVVGDTLLVALLAMVTTAPAHPVFGHDPQLLCYQFALLLPLAWRRRAPYLVFAVVAAVALAQWLYAGRVLPGDVALLVALYTVAAHGSRRRTAVAFAVIAVGNLMAAYRWASPERGTKVFVALCGLALAAGMIGANMHNRRAYLAALEDRAARLERERDQRAQLAVAGERARIAREMHDIVTHSLSVMVALADGAAFAAPRAPEKAAAAMEQVSGTGRQALTDMRRFLGVLRADEPDALRHPQPGIAQLDALATQVRAVGLPVRLRVEGDAASVPAAAQLTVYRLVQEALTNTLKHAAAGARASVRVSCPGDRVEVEIRDDGHPVPSSGEGGHGIDGMRDRVAAYGGHLEAGPLPGGGWRVATCLKLGDLEPVDVEGES